MKELFEAVWNMPANSIISLFLGGVFGYFLGMVLIIIAIKFFWK